MSQFIRESFEEDESDCGGTGCVESNYVPVVSSGSYSTAGSGTSASGPTVDQSRGPITTTTTTYNCAEVLGSSCPEYTSSHDKGLSDGEIEASLIGYALLALGSAGLAAVVPASMVLGPEAG